MGGEMRQDALPKELMILQLGQIDLLMAMYASDDAIVIDAASSDLLEELRDWCESTRDTVPQFIEPCISMLLDLEVSDVDDSSLGRAKSLQLNLSVPLVYEGKGTTVDSDTEPPPIKARIQQPGWMSRGEVARLTTEIPEEDILTVIEHVKEAASQHLAGLKQEVAKNGQLNANMSLVRVWFYFPSISTRSKRDDLIQHAPTYGLTGFLLAGKPGILCLEGGSPAIDQFMKFIKTESWGDIPSQHKKVSERFREEGPDMRRAFNNMREITDMVGERRGERANRNDMKALETWLNESGLGEAFGKVFL
ncbi:Fc.00g058550.m01.CDS01 [Cosmosporella sp. VM-42]